MTNLFVCNKLFLSGCRTGQTAALGAVESFARVMVKEYGIPAVLGWARPVRDDQAAAAAGVIYRELSRGQSIPDAVKRARLVLKEKYQERSEGPLLRLFAAGRVLNALVTTGQKKRPKPRRLKHSFLKNSRVKIRVLSVEVRRLLKNIFLFPSPVWV
ncbi:MAG: CHAT domain-containing protein [bacterium]|nr:CHAT domain-containing protein [bacterium]